MWLTPLILVIWEITRMEIWGQSRQKVRETLSQPMAWCGGVHLSSQLYGEAQIGGSHPGIKQDPSEKYLKLKEWQSGSNGRALT
jgi:hypothetical protein